MAMAHFSGLHVKGVSAKGLGKREKASWLMFGFMGRGRQKWVHLERLSKVFLSRYCQIVVSQAKSSLSLSFLIL